MTTPAHGSWPSPLSAEAVVAAGVGLGGPLVAEDGSVWWSEARPDEGGRIQLVRRTPDGASEEVLPEGWSARTRVHEYGGGAWWLHGTSVFFSSWADHRLYRLDVDPWGHGTGLGVELTPEAPTTADPSSTNGSEGATAGAPSTPVALTPVPAFDAADRYADGAVTEDGAWVLCVRERHREDGTEPANEIVAVRTGPGPDGPIEPVVVVTGHDFVSHPRIDPTGRWICWLAWDHPRMPWDGTELWVAELLVDPQPDVAPRLVDARRVLGGPEVSVAQPSWTPDGTLVAVVDLDGWWNLWSAPSPGLPEPGTFAQVSTVEGELAQPQWVFGQSWYGHLPDGTVVGSWRFDGTDHLGVLDPGERVPRWLDLGTTSTLGLHVGADGQVAVVAASFTSEAQVALIELGDHPGTPRHPVANGDLDDVVEQRQPADRHPLVPADGDGAADEVAPGGAHEHLEVIRPPRALEVDATWWSVPSTITFPTTGDREAHALWYPPHNPQVGEVEGSVPPVLVLGHGGPTSAARPHLDLAIQYWTTRGWGVVDVNYGGSTGYGRPYRRQLDGQWGVVDVDDLCAAAEHLVSRGLADPQRLAIKGGSAGGFTVLAALAFRDTFSAGASRYGIADLEALARDTHKFESRYTDGLVAPYPEGRDLYVERSPIHHLDGFDKPLLVLQGLLDEVVPPNQAEMIVEALEAKGVPVAYVEFPDEAHGFRSGDAILAALLSEHYFLSEVLGIETADELPAIPIRGPGDRLGKDPS